MKIKHEHIESVLFALAAEKGQAWVPDDNHTLAALR